MADEADDAGALFADLARSSQERLDKLGTEGFDTIKRNNEFAIDRVRRNANVALAAKLGYPIPNPFDEPALPAGDEARPIDVPSMDEGTQTA